MKKRKTEEGQFGGMEPLSPSQLVRLKSIQVDPDLNPSDASIRRNIRLYGGSNSAKRQRSITTRLEQVESVYQFSRRIFVVDTYDLLRSWARD